MGNRNTPLHPSSYGPVMVAKCPTVHSRVMKRILFCLDQIRVIDLCFVHHWRWQKNATPLFLFFFLSFGSYAKILEDKEFLLYMTFEVTCQKRHHGEKRVDKNSHLPPQLESLQGISLVTWPIKLGFPLKIWSWLTNQKVGFWICFCYSPYLSVLDFKVSSLMNWIFDLFQTWILQATAGKKIQFIKLIISTWRIHTVSFEVFCSLSEHEFGTFNFNWNIFREIATFFHRLSLLNSFLPTLPL